MIFLNIEKKWEHVKDADVLPLLDEITTCYGGNVVVVDR